MLVRRYGKRELEKLDVRFLPLLHLSTVECSWTIRAAGSIVRERIRVTRTGERFNVALPGRGGTFSLSYSYIGEFPVHGTGWKTIKAWLETPGSCGARISGNEHMNALVASIIDNARKMLIKRYAI